VWPALIGTERRFGYVNRTVNPVLSRARFESSRPDYV